MSDEVALEISPRLHPDAVLVASKDEFDAEFAQGVANWKATADADYRLRRDYAKVGREE